MGQAKNEAPAADVSILRESSVATTIVPRGSGGCSSTVDVDLWVIFQQLVPPRVGDAYEVSHDFESRLAHASRLRTGRLSLCIVLQINSQLTRDTESSTTLPDSTAFNLGV